MLDPFRIFQPDTEDVETLQENLQEFFKGVEDNPLLDGRYIEDEDLAVGANTIEHKLSRVPRGWFLCDVDAAGTDVYRSSALDDKHLKLTAAAICTVKIWVF